MKLVGKYDNLDPKYARRFRSAEYPQDIRVGRYFLLSDFLYSASVAKGEVFNYPLRWTEGDQCHEVRCLTLLCKHILDPVVEQFGHLSVTFGYYSNDGGLHGCIPVTSQKEEGSKLAAAADILVHSHRKTPRTVALWIRNNCPFERIILYPNSPIICVAWSDMPRGDFKEWAFPNEVRKAVYINALEEEQPNDGDRLWDLSYIRDPQLREYLE